MNLSETLSQDYIESQYKQWKADANSVSRDWRFFFEGFELAAGMDRKADIVYDEKEVFKQARVEALIRRYREIGHLLACFDPLTACPTDHPLLNLSAFDLTPNDLDTSFFAKGLVENDRAPLKVIIQALKETYCRSIGVEFMHLQDPEERKWLQDRMEPDRNTPDLKADDKFRILEKLYQSDLFEQFLQKKYLGQTRFSIEGAEVVIPMLDALVDRAASLNCREIILGMAHRGRLNVQTNMLNKPYEEIFSEFESCHDPNEIFGAGDVKYHDGYLADVTTRGGVALRIYLVNNPSHLESVNPVVEGFARGRQDILKDDKRNVILPLLIHGDAAFSGQGVVTETLNMSQLSGYKTGGTVHIVINNQIGYTTLPEHARSTRYATDVAKMLMIPIFHIHGEDPESAVHAIRLALDYRETFNKDVVVDVVCFRRYGHNEGDEPYFTQPQMYDRIRKRLPLNVVYSQKLLERGVIRKDDAEALEMRINRNLEDAFEAVKSGTCIYPQHRFYENWENFHGAYSHESVKTSVPKSELVALGRKLNTFPEEFSLNEKLVRLMKKRQDSIEEGHSIDWANAEALAFASLLTEGEPVRLSGQDSVRGTFSQRHSILFDTKTGNEYIPFNALNKIQAPFLVYNSLLSESGVLGFEYGYSTAQPRGLVVWEAQFGDFANNAQSIIDLYIASGQAKWQRLSGLVLLLPHGWEGLGPEHSSARLERFLQLCAKDNIQVCNLTTPAQYFHILRRQAKERFRLPLIIMTPKSLLRHPLAISELSDLSSGEFKEVLEDPDASMSARCVLFCSGKIYYELLQKRRELKKNDFAIVRLEQFYPFPENQLKTVLQKYKKARRFVWVQEEPENMGAWFFLRLRLENILGKPIEYVGRNAAASTATGFHNIYRKEQAAVSNTALGIEGSDDK